MLNFDWTLTPPRLTDETATPATLRRRAAHDPARRRTPRSLVPVPRAFPHSVAPRATAAPLAWMMGRSQGVMEMRTDLFRLMVEASADGLWILDEHGAHHLRQRRGWPSCSGATSPTWTDSRPSTPSTRPGTSTCDGTWPTWSTATRARWASRRSWSVPTAACCGPWSTGPSSATTTAPRLGWLHRVTEYTDRKRSSTPSASASSSWRPPRASPRSAAGTGTSRPTRSPGPTSSTASTTSSRGVRGDVPGLPRFVHPDDRAMVAEASWSRPSPGADEFALRRPDHPRGRRVALGPGPGRRRARRRTGRPVRMGGTAQDITDLVRPTSSPPRPPGAWSCCSTMAMAANQATSLDEAIAMAAAGLPAHTTWSPVGVVRRGRTTAP